MADFGINKVTVAPFWKNYPVPADTEALLKASEGIDGNKTQSEQKVQQLKTKAECVKEGHPLFGKDVPENPHVELRTLQRKFAHEKEHHRGPVDKFVLQPVHNALDKVTTNRCSNDRVDQMLTVSADETPTPEFLKAGREAIDFNGKCEDIGVPTVAGAAAFVAGAVTGELGAVPTWGLLTGAATDLAIEGGDTIGNDQPFTLGDGLGATARGAAFGYAGASLTYKPEAKSTPSTPKPKPSTPTTPVKPTPVTPPPVTPTPVTPPPPVTPTPGIDPIEFL